MSAPLTLPRLSWGDPSASRRALLVHGLGSSGALMWRVGDALAADGWHATAVDLRGHGDAPRATDYSVAAYASDLIETRSADGAPWDAVIGHSLGGASSIVAAASDPQWAQQLVLLDPAVFVSDHDAGIVRASQERAFADTRLAVVQEEHPHWHPQDQELKVDAVLRASAWAVEQTNVQNQPWDVRDQARSLTVPTHVIAADPAVYSIFTGDLADEVLAANPLISMSIVDGAGHSVHRDQPEESLRQLREALS